MNSDGERGELVFQLFSVVEFRALCRTLMSVWTWFVHRCIVMLEILLSTGILSLEKKNLNVTAYKNILDHFLFLTLWQRFLEEPHWGIIRCPNTFGRTL